MFNFSYYSNSDEDFLLVFAIIWCAVMLAACAVGLAIYVFRSLAVYTIAKRRELNRPWLAWIPVASDWILGSISDQYKYLTQGKNQMRRKILLGLSIAAAVCAAVCFCSGVVLLTSLTVSVGSQLSDAQMASLLMGPVIVLMLVSLFAGVVGIAKLVFKYMCKYDLYKSCEPKNAVAYLVLEILFGLLEPVFLMVVRNKDLGMPPRKGAPQPEQPAPTPAIEEPWEHSEN